MPQREDTHISRVTTLPQPGTGQTAPATVSAMALVQKATTIYHQAQQFMEQSQAAFMECLWELKTRHCDNDDETFKRFARDHLDVIPPTQAVKLANTWETVREHRGLREWAQAKPKEAMSLICQFQAGGLTVTADDPAVARILTLPPKQRTAAIQALMETKAGHHPADKERIQALTAERDAALAELSQAHKVSHLADTPKRRLAKYAEDCDALLQQLREFAAQSDAHLSEADYSSLADEVLLAHQERLAQFERELTLLGEIIRNQWLTHVREVR